MRKRGRRMKGKRNTNRRKGSSRSERKRKKSGSQDTMEETNLKQSQRAKGPSG